MPSGAGSTSGIPPSDSENLVEGRQRMYECEEFAITKWDHGPLGHYYQIIAKDEARKRGGNGYILLSPMAMQELCNALVGKVW